MSVFVTGDIHGDPRRLNTGSFYEQKQFSGDQDEKNGNKRKQLCGFLSPSGVFTEADSYEHMQVSKEIVEKEYGQILPGIDAERLLLEKGYIGFYSRDVGFLWIVNHNIRNLTQEQVEFIQDHIEDANNSDQRHAIEALLSSNMDVKERHVLDLYGIGSG